jgi:hypothetical protein
VLLVREPETLDSLGPALWATFEEVEKLYNLDRQLARFSRTCVAPEMPAGLTARIRSDDSLRPDVGEWNDLWDQCGGSYSDTIDQRCLVGRLKKMLGHTPRPLNASAIVVTDEELTPPPQWRYILWEACDGVTVVSTAAMDPEYWGISDPDRLRTLKHRVRASCMCAVGMALGFDRCENEQCYLFEKVDSVLRLDLMRTIGREHREYPADEPVGYFIHEGDPAEGQEVVSAEDLQVQGWPQL